MSDEWLWPGTVIDSVIDGDTVDCRVTRDIGFGGTVTFPIRLRLNRINTARATTARGRSGTALVLARTAGQVVHVTTVKGYKYGAPKYKTGEYMAEVVLPDGSNLSDVLVDAGLAAYWDGAGPRPSDN